MVNRLVAWALDNVIVVALLAAALIGFGGIAFLKVNVEAYPDPAPAIIEVVAQFPGASAEEVERQVTTPLEVALSGMPGLKYTRSKSLFGLAYVNNQFEYGVDYHAARQEVTNRLPTADLPDGVKPEISPRSPIGEIYRYTLSNPRDEHGHEIYALSDRKSLQNWTLERELKRLPGVAAVVSFGGTLKRYEIHPDPERLRQYGITLDRLENAVSESNANVSGDYLLQGSAVKVVRSIGLIGHGHDPIQRAQGMKDARAAAKHIRDEERRRLLEIRQIVITTTNNVPVRVEHVVDGGPLNSDDEAGLRGVVVGYQTRTGRVSISKPVRDPDGHEVLDAQGNRQWLDDDDAVQGLVLLRKGKESLPTLQLVDAKVRELNSTPGRLLPGVQIEPYYTRTSLIDVTTETVHHNLVLGLVFVSTVLLMFLGNVRTAVIVAINIPLALLFAFCVLFLRHKSANLLSIGAVDFGIIVDSTVIMVENIYRRVTSHEGTSLSLKERILRASREVERSLFFSTIIMVCAMLPLFTMSGPEGQIFGPMADTYAFALGGALLLALTVSPVLCLTFFGNLKPHADNFLVRWLKRLYVGQLQWLLDRRWAAAAVFGAMVLATGLVIPTMGREFMPELEEGHMWIRGIFPPDVSLDEVSRQARLARSIMRKYPEVDAVACQIGRPDAGTDPIGFYSAEFFVPLKPPDQWPAVKPGGGLFQRSRSRTKAELIRELNAELSTGLIGINWNFSQQIRDNVMEVLSGVQGENSVKIIGNDLDRLEQLGQQIDSALRRIPGIADVGVYRIKGQTNLEFPIDLRKCAYYNVTVTDVEHVVQTAVAGLPVTRMIEGERSYDITLRWPERLRSDEEMILNIPVDVTSNRVTSSSSMIEQTASTGPAAGLSAMGTSRFMPSITGSALDAPAMLSEAPRRRLRDFVTPITADDVPDPNGQFVQSGASVITREEGKRLVAVKFSVRGRDLAGAVAEAQETVRPLLPPGYEDQWSGEFQQMREAEQRMAIVVVLALALILVMLYMAFRSLLDAVVVLANVLAMSLGGVWTLLVMGLSFNISAAVGFISILGVAVMNGLLMVSSFNMLRAHGQPVREAIVKGTEKLVRPITMTALAAILGLLPAAVSTRIGSQSQRPLAMVVVGGMLMTLFLFNLVPILYSFYGHRDPPEGSGHFAE